jgi:[citrate (pro-3S)-lyase] ligase
MEYFQLSERILQINHESERAMLENFLKLQGLRLESDVEYCIALLEGERIVATGCLSGRVCKCIAVDKAYQGTGLTGTIISNLTAEAFRRGRKRLFIYTRPENWRFFRETGFYKVAEVTKKVVLLENDPLGLKNFLAELEEQYVKGENISAIVVNCNPFTLGHQYLIEKAAALSEVLHVFVLWEDKSSFPSEVRYRLVCEGTKHLPNVYIHKGRDYIISDATFPSYFLKEFHEIVEVHARLDLTIFKTHIAPVLGIKRRFVGEEPYCPVTRTYNSIMKKELPEAGIDVVEIPRFKVGEEAVSASRVRKLIAEGRLDEVQGLVPATTMKFLLSPEAEPIISKIKAGCSRH